MSTVALSDAEREALHAGVCARHRDDAPGVYVCRPCESVGDAVVERIIADRLAAQREEIAAAIEGRVGAGHLMTSNERCAFRDAARIAREVTSNG